MIALIALLVEATPTPAPTMNVDQIMAILADSIALGKNLPGIFGAIFVGIIALALALIIIAKYFMDRGQREKEAYLEDQRIRKIQAENTARMQKDAVEALISNMDVSYQQDYAYFTQMIKQQRYPFIYMKIAPQFKEEIATFLYDDTQPAEVRAARVIQVIRKV